MLNILNSEEFIFFTTREYALEAGISLSAASKRLKRLARKDLIVQVVRGIWSNPMHPYFTPMGCVPYLVGNEQGYISFLSALHRHGIVSQIPHVIQVATTGHARILKTPIGIFEFLQIKPEMMVAGIEWSEARVSYRIASPEKALLDMMYISTRKKKRFSSVPEFEINTANFDKKKLRKLLKELLVPDQIKKAIIKYMKNIYYSISPSFMA